MSFKLYLLFEFFALFSCIYNYKLLPGYFKLFLIYLVLIVIYETGNRFKLFLWHGTTSFSDNIESILEITIFGTFMSSLPELKSHKIKIRYSVAAGIALYLVDMFFIQGVFKMATIGIVTQCVFIAVLVCVYYNLLMKKGDDSINLSTYPPFWATMALLFYSLIDFFYFGTFSYMLYTRNFYFSKVVSVFGSLSSLALYVLLGVSFFCFRWQRKPTFNSF